MDDINNLNDPASIGGTFLFIVALLIVNHLYHIGLVLIRDEPIRKMDWLSGILQKSNVLSVVPTLFVLATGMLLLKLVQLFYQSYDKWLDRALIAIIVFSCFTIWFWLEVKIRQLIIRWWEKKKLKKLGNSYGENKGALHFSIDKVFGEKTAREVMTPRLDMICLDQSQSFQQNIHIAITEMRTRYPVVYCDKDDIIGFIHIKDILAIYDDQFARQNWQQAIRPIITVPESIGLSQLLSMMQKQKTQIALLIDEYGGTSGMVTMEDIIEEIIGDIQDEFDQEEVFIRKLDEDEYIISAMLLIEEFNSYFKVQLEVDEMDSIGGLIYANIQFPPHIGQSVTYHYEPFIFEFTILEMEQLRITSIQVKRMLMPSLQKLQQS